MRTEWITDRLPTKQDADEFGDVWVTLGNGFVCEWNWRSVKPEMPWQPTNKPAPYVSPKRWKVEWNSIGAYWVVVKDDYRVPQYYLNYKDQDAAQRIAEIYNEVMP
jgi:hypothetical protein